MIENNQIKVKLLSKEDDKLLEEFLDEYGRINPSVLGYHYPVYRKMLEQLNIGESLSIAAFYNEEMVGYLPGFIKNSELGTAYCSLPFFGPNGGVIFNPSFTHVSLIHDLLIQNLINTLESKENMLTASFYTPFQFKEFDYYSNVLNENSLYVEKFTQFNYLDTFSVTPKIQYDLRKAKKERLRIVTEFSEEYIKEFYHIYQKNCSENGIPTKPREAVDYLLTEGIKKGISKCYFAFIDQKMIGGLLVLYGPLTVSYYLPCTLSEYKSLNPVTTLIVTAIEDALKDGKKYWNWESSPSEESGVFKFKKKWNPHFDTYRIYIKLFTNEGILKKIGRNKISENFPYFYVFPFNRLL